VVFFEGSVAHTAVLPIGGDHFTNDLAVGLHVSVEEAEQLKRTYGNCVVTSVPQLNEIVTALETDKHVKVIVFDSAVEGYFLTHYDFLAKLEDTTSGLSR